MDCRVRRYVRRGTLIQLLVLDAIARLGSFTLAARELHMAQPTVSIHMKKLADTMGVELVAYTEKRVRLTPAGEKVLAAAQHVFEVLHVLGAGLEEMAQSRTANVQCSICESRPPRSNRRAGRTRCAARR